jgi:hypothetical protein
VLHRILHVALDHRVVERIQAGRGDSDADLPFLGLRDRDIDDGTGLIQLPQGERAHRFLLLGGQR